MSAPDIEGVNLPHLTITYAQAVEKTGLSQKTLQRMAKNGKIRAQKWGRTILLNWTDIEDLIRNLPPAYPDAVVEEVAA